MTTRIPINFNQDTLLTYDKNIPFTRYDKQSFKTTQTNGLQCMFQFKSPANL